MPARPTSPARRNPRARIRDAVAASRAEEIRLAALELFATVGYRATTMADIGAAVGLQGPSVYRHVPSKHDLLVEIMTGTMERLLAVQSAALDGDSDPRRQVRRLVAAHVRYHALHRFETFVGNREIDNLDPGPRRQILRLRARYETSLRRVISRGIEEGVFVFPSARIASYAILDMGMGVSVWHNPSGQHSPDELGELYADMAIGLLTNPPSR